MASSLLPFGIDVPGLDLQIQPDEVKEETMNTVCRIGLDTAKNVFQVHALDAQGCTVTTRRLRRRQVLDWFARLDRANDCLVGLEATGGSHYWARELQRLGYRVRMLNPQAVKPYRQGQKNDARDAAAIAEAVAREAVSEAPIKSEYQQALLARQGYRRRLVERRNALGNQLRGYLAEFGIVAAQGFKKLKERLAQAMEEADNGLPADLRAVLADGADELRDLDRRIAQQDREIARQARANEDSCRLMELDGIGPLTALRLVAICGDGRAWCNGREFAVSMGMTPTHHGSGEHMRLGGITKQGDTELRTLLVHGARSTLRRADQGGELDDWSQRLRRRRPHNVAAVALAHKRARIAWAMLAHGTRYQPPMAA
jgi:transposase